MNEFADPQESLTQGQNPTIGEMLGNGAAESSVIPAGTWVRARFKETIQKTTERSGKTYMKLVFSLDDPRYPAAPGQEPKEFRKMLWFPHKDNNMAANKRNCRDLVEAAQSFGGDVEEIIKSTSPDVAASYFRGFQGFDFQVQLGVGTFEDRENLKTVEYNVVANIKAAD
jgi:hypothetical protein